MLRHILVICFLFISSHLFASVEIYTDCSNYCAFREIENNCHGIAFKKIKNGKTDYLYTHWSSLRNGCQYSRIPDFHFISQVDVQKSCTCEGLPELPPVVARNLPISESTIQELKELRTKIKGYAPCAPDPLLMAAPIDDQHPYLPTDVQSCESMKEQGKPFYLVLGACLDPGNPNCSYYGNTNNYSGPLCMAGDLDRCEEVRKSQNPITGAWYRSAYQMRFPITEHGQPLFSRDEFLGVMLYLIKTKDVVAAEKWLRFIANNPKKPLTLTRGLIKAFNICPPHVAVKPSDVSDSDWARMQPDDRCEMRGDSWAAMYKVYRFLGFTNRELKAINAQIYYTMKAYAPTASLVANLSSRTVPAFGYEAGNQATNILILKSVGMKDDLILQDAARAINQRTGFESAYYHWLDQGVATEYGAYLIKKYCPPQAPNYRNPPQGGYGVPAAGFFDYAVHYFNGISSGWEANLPTGHECIGWINFYLNDTK